MISSEFGLIDRIKKVTRVGKHGERIIVPIGDDAAGFLVYENSLFLISTDSFVEDYHFKREYFSYEDIGYKSLAVNISDIAAMGGYPLYYLVSLGIPKEISDEDVERIYRGFSPLEREHSLRCIGGDIVFSEKLFISITIVGEVEKENLLTRGGANAGDIVYITGYTGEAHAGFEILNSNLNGGKYEGLIKKHLRPDPRLKVIRRLIKSGKRITSLIDVSDGLAISLNLLSKESTKSFFVKKAKIPISRDLMEFSSSLGKDPISFALYGGEDYELLFTAPSDETIPRRVGNVPITPIGWVEKGKGVYLVSGKDKERLDFRGYGQAFE